MEASAVLETLLEHDVLSLSSGSGDVKLSESFKRRIQEQSTVAWPSVNEAYSDIAEALEDAPEALGILRALYGAGVELDTTELVRSISVIAYLRCPPAHTRGAPPHFLAIPGDLLQGVLNLHRAAVVYVWKQDCPPCEIVRDDLGEIFDSDPDDIALFAVFGPESEDLLKDAYDVVGAPTLLFALNGSVDARLLGAHSREVVAAEVDNLRNLAFAESY